MKPSDLDPHCFHFACKYMLITGMLEVNKIKIGKKVVHKSISMPRVKDSSCFLLFQRGVSYQTYAESKCGEVVLRQQVHSVRINGDEYKSMESQSRRETWCGKFLSEYNR